jgi:hypothetical protein
LAVGVAKARTAGKALAVAEGTYAATSLQRIFVYGGYEAGTWLRNVATHPTVITATAPVLIGGVIVGGSTGGIDGLTITGNSSGALVKDEGLGTEVRPVTSLVSCQLECSDCAGPVVDLNNSNVSVLNTRVRGGTAGIHAAPAGGLGVTTFVNICGNDVAGGAGYSRAIEVGEMSRLKVEVSWNDVSLDDEASVGIRVGLPNLNYLDPALERETATLSHNLILGRAATGIDTSAGSTVAGNLIHLLGANSRGVFGRRNNTRALPMTLLGNAIQVVDSAVSLENFRDPLDSPAPAWLVNNSLRGRVGVSVSSLDASPELNLVNNIVHGVNAALSIEAEFGGPQTALKNNDFIASDCLLSVNPTSSVDPPICVASLAALAACTWDGCTSALGNLRISPHYDVAGSLRVAPGSPCIDAGTTPNSFGGAWVAGFAGLLSPDVNGDVRPSGAAWDIGADEVP